MILFCALAVPAAAAAAENLIEPGQWKVTSNTAVNGAASPPQVKSRCVTAEQAGDVAKTFGPVSGSVNSTCEPTVFETAGRTLKWHLQCKGSMVSDVKQQLDVKTELEGERVGECQP
jgi:hypothetical protein